MDCWNREGGRKGGRGRVSLCFGAGKSPSSLGLFSPPAESRARVSFAPREKEKEKEKKNPKKLQKGVEGLILLLLLSLWVLTLLSKREVPTIR